MQKNRGTVLQIKDGHKEEDIGDTVSSRNITTKGCGLRFWQSVQIILYILWSGSCILFLIAAIDVLRPDERALYGFWGVVGLLGLFFIVFYWISEFIRFLIRFVAKRLTKMEP